jgi:hypothetical protein
MFKFLEQQVDVLLEIKGPIHACRSPINYNCKCEGGMNSAQMSISIRVHPLSVSHNACSVNCLSVVPRCRCEVTAT